MILVDSSIWIDHLHSAEPALIKALHNDEAGTHPLVIEELALGSLKQRHTVLQLLSHLTRFPLVSHTELMTLVEGHRLWSRGLSAVDAHLLAATLVHPGARLWTRDRRLLAACRDVGCSVVG